MKFSVSRRAMLEAFQVAGSVISTRAIRPILSNLHVVVRDGSAAVMATDLEISIRYHVPLDSMDEPGEAVIPATRVTAILKECSSEQVNFEAQSEGRIRLTSDKSSFNLLSENPQEFPAISEFKESEAFGLEREKLVSLIRKTLFAVAKEKSRFAFNGAKLYIEGSEARMIATDGKRLVMKIENIDNSDELSAGHIIPARALTVFEKILADDDETVCISLEENRVMVKTTKAEISSQLVEGSFPNYKAVIPEECSTTLTFGREELIQAFRQASLLTSQETRSVKLVLADGKAFLSAQALDAGEAKIELAVSGYDAEPFHIAFNPDFIVEGLRVMDADEIQIGFSRPNQPVKITGEDNFVYVVMPITTRNG